MSSESAVTAALSEPEARVQHTARTTPIRDKTMRCAMCGQVKNLYDGFPMTIYAECWKCVWERHCALHHKPKRKWHLRWPIFRDPLSDDEIGRRNFHEDREVESA